MQLVLGGREPRVVRLTHDRITLGRSPENDVVLRDPEVSRFHLAIEPIEGGHLAVDLDSSNGTYLNGRRIHEAALEPEDRIAFGHQLATYAPPGHPLQVPAPEPSVLLDPWEAWSTTTSICLAKTPRAAFDTRLFQALNQAHRAEGGRADTAQRLLLQVSLLSQSLNSQVDVYQLLEVIVEELLELTGGSRGLLLRCEEGGALWSVMDRRREAGPLHPTFPVDAVHTALEREEPLAWFSREGRAYLCLPLRARTRISARDRRRTRSPKRALGALLFEDVSALPEDQLWVLEAVAGHAASGLRQAHLHRLATTDRLTGLENRSVLEQVLAEETTGEAPFVVILLDIDHFKRVNDEHGHAVGDEVLTRIARRLRRATRRDDYVGRWGGEEFLVILPGEDLPGALTVTRKVADSIGSTPIGTQRLRVTASMGLAVYPDHGSDGEALIARADQALYEAKRTGRDRVCVYSSDEQTRAER